MMSQPLKPDSRRVSLPTSLMSPRLYPGGCRLSPAVSPTRLSPLKSPTRRSLPPTPPTPRRSLPGTPRSGSPRPASPRPPRALANVDEHLPTSSSSSSSEHTTPYHSRRRRNRYPRYQQYSAKDLAIMAGDDELQWGQVPRTGSQEGQLRSFAYKYGSVFDNGFEAKDKPGKTGDSRRATCPEICLFPPTRPSRRVVLRVYGEKNTGKKTLLHQLHKHASTTRDEVMVVDDDGSGKSSNFLLNGEEIQLELLIESALEMEPFSCNLPVYIIMYSVDSRETFHYAQQLLSRISQTHGDKPHRAILVGNKLDLKRNQVVTSIEGKCMSKIYKSSFVEVSALLGMNLDILWAELIRQLEHPGETTWVEKVVNRGKVFAKSCEEIVMRLVAA